ALRARPRDPDRALGAGGAGLGPRHAGGRAPPDRRAGTRESARRAHGGPPSGVAGAVLRAGGPASSRAAFESESGSVTRRESLQARIDALGPWFHNLHLDGLETAPTHPFGDFPTFKWEQIAPHIDADLSGRTVLDIGCNAG